jgi:hypothetical protein
MARGRAALCPVLLLALGVASCASDRPPRAPGAEARAYFPLERGGHWSYELHTGFFSASTRMEVTARGEHAVRDSNEALFLMEEQLSGRVYGLEPAGLVGYRVEDGYLTRIPAVSLGEDGRVRVFGGDAMSFLPLDPTPGQTWGDRSEVFRESGGARQLWTAQVEAVGSMRVSAGRFDDVIVVRSQQWDPEWDASEPLHSYEDYYARGIGLIRSVSRNNASWWFMAVEQELVAVRFDSSERE